MGNGQTSGPDRLHGEGLCIFLDCGDQTLRSHVKRSDIIRDKDALLPPLSTYKAEFNALWDKDREDMQMAKPNALLAKLEAKYDNLFRIKMEVTMQMGQDAAMIAAHEVLQLGPGRAREFCMAYKDAVRDMARMTVEDQKDDHDFVYAKAKIDEVIRSIVGEENFEPWEVRYGEKAMPVR